jgi:hypothetical protein
MSTRKRSRINYNDEHYEESEEFTVDNIGSTSNWDSYATDALRIDVIDVHELLEMFDVSQSLYSEAEQLVLSEWNDNSWLQNVELKSLNHNNRIKTLIGKIRNVYVASRNITEVYVDGFMDSLLHMLCFDEYPCFLYPQYEFSANIGSSNHTVTARSDFSVLSESSGILLVIEDKTVTNATYANNWKEHQVLGELFVAVHNVVAKSVDDLIYPLSIYAIRVIGTLFTFYKTIATLDYIKETARVLPGTHRLKILRHPPVENNPSKLTAYNICDKAGRKKILECMCSIRRSLAAAERSVGYTSVNS